MGSAATLLAVIGEVQGFESKAMRASYGGIALLRSLSPSALSAFLGEPGARYTPRGHRLRFCRTHLSHGDEVAVLRESAP